MCGKSDGQQSFRRYRYLLLSSEYANSSRGFRGQAEAVFDGASRHFSRDNSSSVQDCILCRALPPSALRDEGFREPVAQIKPSPVSVDIFMLISAR